MKLQSVVRYSLVHFSLERDRSALAQVRILFESGVYSRAASHTSYTVWGNIPRIFVLQIIVNCESSTQNFVVFFSQFKQDCENFLFIKKFQSSDNSPVS